MLIREINGRPMRFRFIDNPSKLSAGEWDRIVCIIAGTQPWQFRGVSQIQQYCLVRVVTVEFGDL